MPDGLQTLLAYVACIAAAQPIEGYQADLQGAGLAVFRAEQHNEALLSMIDGIRTRLLGAELLVQIKRLGLEGVDFGQAQAMARLAAESAQVGQLGYALFTATRPF